MNKMSVNTDTNMNTNMNTNINKIYNLLVSDKYIPCYEGEGDGGEGSGSEGQHVPGVGEPSATGAATGTGQNNGGRGPGTGVGTGSGTGSGAAKRLFTQEEVNTYLAEDRRKSKGQTEKLIAELEELKKNRNLSEQDKSKLQRQIEEYQAQIMTKEQLAEKEKSKLQQEYQSELQRERNEKESWRNRFSDATVVRSITDAAVKHDAFSPEQLVSYLQPQTRLVEEVDQDGKGTGNYIPRVKFKDVDSEGKPTVLDLTIEEAVKRMKDITDRFGNLFKANVTGGLGGTGSTGQSGSFDPSRIKTVEEYQKHRERLVGRKHSMKSRQ